MDGTMSLEEVAGETSEGPRTPNHQEGSLALNTPGANANYLSQQSVVDGESRNLADYVLPSAWVSDLRMGNETLGSLGLFGSY
jgi:hypothetical protein